MTTLFYLVFDLTYISFNCLYSI